MPSRLVPWPRRAWPVVVACLVVVLALAVAFHDKNHGTGFDDSVDHWLRAHGQPFWKTLIHITDPAKVFGLYAVLVAWAIWRRRWPVVALAVLTPLVTTGLVEYVLKPVVHRTPYVAPGDIAVVKSIFGGSIPTAYPSGHESVLGSLVAVCGLLVVTTTWTLRRKLAALALLVVVALVGAVSLVGRYYHYATDTIGAMFLCVAMVLLVGMAVDAAVDALAARRTARTAELV